MNEKTDLITFSDIAVRILELYGFTPELCASEDEAREKANHLNLNSKKWPCHFFNSDTTGEKPFEEFYTSEDKVNFDTYHNVGIICQPVFKEYYKIEQALEAFERIRESDQWLKEDIVNAIKIIIPELEHEEKHKSLDEKM